jgi:quercetin dioxygenase-like cupin family protein
MRVISAIALLTLSAAVAPAFAQVAPESATTLVVAGDSRAPVAMAAWQKGGALQSASGDAVKQAPRKAVRYEAKMVAWPTATVKVLTFTRKGGGVLHPLTDETTVYVLSGSVDTTVDGKPVTLATGDLASLPKGALTNPGKKAVDAVVVAWTAASLTPGATPAVVRVADVPPNKMGQMTIRRYTFPGNSVRAVGQDAGFKTTPATAKTDSLIYVTSGAMTFFQDGQTFNVKAGDFIREVAGLMHNWDVGVASSFVTTSALPVGAGPIDPNKATDRPPQ